jgi:hypothetical protein
MRRGTLTTENHDSIPNLEVVALGRFISIAKFKWLYNLTPEQLTVISRFTGDLAAIKVTGAKAQFIPTITEDSQN